jgi:hypothetical protein
MQNTNAERQRQGCSGVRPAILFTLRAAFTALISITAVSAANGIIYVDDDNVTGPWDGSSAHPYRFIQEGVDAGSNGARIVVFPGLYTENVVIDSKDVAIVSSLSGDPNAPHATLVDGGQSGSVIRITQAEVRLEGLGLTNGLAPNGAGLFCDNSQVRVFNSVLSYNRTPDGNSGNVGEPGGVGGSSGNGGGVFCLSSLLELTDCEIRGNATGHGGRGGNGDPYLGGSGGRSGNGGGLHALYSTVEMNRCIIHGNATGNGGGGGDGDGYGGDGGISGAGGGLCSIDSALLLRNCELTDNTTGSGGNGGAGDFAIGGDSGSGGALYCVGGSISIEGCRINGNASGDGGHAYFYAGGLGGDSGHGAGLCILDCQLQSIVQCELADNTTGSGGTAAWPGGGGGAAGSGGGAYVEAADNVEISQCVFSGNRMGFGGEGEFGADGGSGGGLYCRSQSQVSMEQSRFFRNYAGNGSFGWEYGGFGGDGGGAWIDSPSTVLARCVFTGNCAGEGYLNMAGNGGGLLCTGSVSAENCLFANNATGGSGDSDTAGNGGGMSAADVTAVNCTICDNTAGENLFLAGLGGGLYAVNSATVSNTILWYNLAGGVGDEIAQLDAGTPAVNHSSIQGWTGAWGGTGNSGDEPVFVNSANRNYRLLHGSPCIDAGSNAFVTAATDLDGGGRILDGDHDGSAVVDMGAYEYGNLEEKIIYVDQVAQGANDGTSWADAFVHLSDALSFANYGNEIRVAQGTYRPDTSTAYPGGTGSDASFHLADGAKVIGGYAGLTGLNPDERDVNLYASVLSGHLAGSDGHSSHVIISRRLGPDTLLQGFTITEGRAEGAGWEHRSGGGLCCVDSSVHVVECRFIANAAFHSGGGIYHGTEEIFQTEAVLRLERCLFSDNHAGDSGGGIIAIGADAEMVECIFVGNSAEWGAAVAQDHATTTLTRCLVADNASPGFAAIAGNPFCTLTNCTIADNSAGVDICHGGLSIQNCIIWGNTAYQILIDSEFPAETTVAYSNIQGGWAGEGNISADPLFAGGEDYHLKSEYGRWNPSAQLWMYDAVTSPCIDAGDPSDAGWKNELWPHGERINMGAYGGTPEASMSPSLRGNPADVTRDGCVGTDDLLAVADKWMTEQSLCPEDMNLDGRIDYTDFLTLAQNWAFCVGYDLAGLWEFNEDSGSTAYDTSTYHHNGLLINGPVRTGSGTVGFDGVDDYVEVPHAESLNFPNAVTVAARIYITDYMTSWPKLVVKPHSTYADPWEMFALDLGRYGNCPRFLITDGQGQGQLAIAVNNSITLDRNRWYHLAGTYNGAVLSLYVDGEPAASTAASFAVGQSMMPLSIGGRLGVNSFCGQIDHVRVYNRGLSGTEIRALYERFRPQP